MDISKVLIANRGECAIRIHNTLKSMGMKSVMIFLMPTAVVSMSELLTRPIELVLAPLQNLTYFKTQSSKS